MLMASPNGYPLSNGRSSSCGYLTGNIPGLDRAQPPRNLDVRLLGQNMATFVPQSQIHPTRGKRFRLRTPLPMSPSPTAMAFKPCTSTSLSYLSRLGTKSNGPHSGTEAHGLTSSQGSRALIDCFCSKCLAADSSLHCSSLAYAWHASDECSGPGVSLCTLLIDR